MPCQRQPPPHCTAIMLCPSPPHTCRGDPGMKAAFATRLSGSEDLYATSGRRPYHSINFIVAHDGFTLYDMVGASC